jgi:Holliday junction resolvase RusA-like endonuclease
MIESNQKQLDDWRSAVRLAAGRAYTRRELFDGPVKVKLVFILQRPKNASKKIEERPGKRPDADKLCRAVFDCLTNVVISDDSRIVDFQAAKYYDYHDLPGCSVEVSEVLELPLRKEC